MIFVTVGTHEQPFDRLLKCIDNMIEKGIINEEVVVQKGYTEYEPKNYKAVKLMRFDEMQSYIDKARIIITHGGPASFISALAVKKIPIVFPRKKEFNEHVNDHQFIFSKEVEKRMKNIIVAENEEQLTDAIVNYDELVKKLNSGNCSNNKNFNEKLSNLIEEMFK